MLEESISDSVRKCLEDFRRIAQAESPINVASDQKAVLDIGEEEARFKVWSGNIGAHSTGRRSLQYRLRDASHLQKQVKSLLDELSELLEDATAIVTGEKVPWDRDEDDEAILLDADSDSDLDDMPATEMAQIAQNVSDVINCLLRLSVAIRNPAPHDRFTTSASIDASHYEPFDIQHVKNKFSGIEPFLANRLGRAISRRRQYFKYRETHHLKLIQGLDSRERHEVESTVASSLPQHAKVDGFSLEAVDEDGVSDSGVTQTSLASSNVDSGKPRMPHLPKEAENGPFECPFCYMMIIATNSVSWKRHVLADLRPYVCLSKDCTTSEMEFVRRHEWTLHEMQNHRKMYTCPCSCGMAFPTKSQCRDHVSKVHPGAFPSSQLDFIIDLSSTQMKDEEEISCPLCREALRSTKEYRRHVGRHQEQLALFALPSLQTTNGDDGSEDGDSGTHSHASSEDVAILHEEKDDLDREDSSHINEDDEARREDAVPPPREEEDEEHVMGRGLLKSPRESREEDEKTEGSTKMNRSIVSPEALNRGNERFEVEGDFVIVKRRLKMDEIRMYAKVTETLREEMIDAEETKSFEEALQDDERFIRVGEKAKDSVQENVKDKTTGESSAVPDMDAEFKARVEAQLANYWAFTEKAVTEEHLQEITRKVRIEAAAVQLQALKKIKEDIKQNKETKYEDIKTFEANLEALILWTEKIATQELASASAEGEEEERVPMPSSTSKGSRVIRFKGHVRGRVSPEAESVHWHANDAKRLDANSPKRNISNNHLSTKKALSKPRPKLNKSSRWGILSAALAGSSAEPQNESEAAEEEVNIPEKSDTDDSIPAEKAIEEARPKVNMESSWGELAAALADDTDEPGAKEEAQFMHEAEMKLSEDQKMAEKQARIRAEEWKREISQVASETGEQQRVESKADNRDKEYD